MANASTSSTPTPWTGKQGSEIGPDPPDFGHVVVVERVYFKYSMRSWLEWDSCGRVLILTAFSAEGHSTKHPGINDLPDVIVHTGI